MLIINHLVVGYNVPCVYPISFIAKQPGIFGIIGPNGAGKSTFLKTLAGLIKPISGTVEISPQLHRVYVPQSYTVNKYFHLTLRDFVQQGFGPNSKDCVFKKQKIDAYLKEWQLHEQRDKCFHELSGGQKTRAMIVRALIGYPDIIFLDEPLASLDSCCQEQLMQTLVKLVQKGSYVFIVDHHLEKFKPFISEWLEFSKHHDDAYARVN